MTDPTPLRAAILVTGDEVLGGRVGERNAAHLARSLASFGITVARTLIVGDRVGEVAGALGELLRLELDLVCTTGGLGPTFDDLTMEAVATATGRRLAMDGDALRMVEERSRGIRRLVRVDDDELDRLRRKQATIPEGASVLPPVGTAPGCALVHDATLIVVLPGPPFELQHMWHAALVKGPVADFVARASRTPERTFRLWGVVEAELVSVLDPLGRAALERIGTYTRDGELEVVAPDDLAGEVRATLRSAFGSLLFSEGPQVDEIVAEALVTRRARLSVAESCTGGGLGARLTAMAGSSRWFDGGVIAYANAVKRDVLGVAETILASDGAVSEASARAMATGVRRLTGATFGVSITGIAGPDGGTPEKPVGLVWIGVDSPAGVDAYEHRFWSGDRETIRRRAQTAALHRLRGALDD